MFVGINLLYLLISVKWGPVTDICYNWLLLLSIGNHDLNAVRWEQFSTPSIADFLHCRQSSNRATKMIVFRQLF